MKNQEWIEQWRMHLLAIEVKKESTLELYSAAVRRFFRETQSEPEEVTALHLENHLQQLYLRGSATSTLASAVSALRSFFGVHHLLGNLKENPAAGFRPPPVYQKERPTLTIPEIRRVLDGPLPSNPLAARDRTMVAISYVLGLRVSEVGPLRLDQIQLHRLGRYSILLRNTKRATKDLRRQLPEANELFEGYLAIRSRELSGPWLFPSTQGVGKLHRHTVQVAFRRVLNSVGIQANGRHLSFHVLRHSLATHLAKAGWSAKRLQEWMRHKSPATTLQYIHVLERELLQTWRQNHPLRESLEPGSLLLGAALLAELGLEG